ncbi:MULTISPECIES: FadR/GntR family transcriptional regulator [Prauserella salsuginis group]|uniref:DNA-binding FadR family transcriptional regulator n=2 Tax=Prauserella salsuginis group TaxID=2893672 RepID=A0A839XYV7_9PSEU|nr:MULTISPECIES: FCD domain-containing protein [Prauserella salsuginis group]MBB3665206.1 DNA-binding FadR family transcriptional regulator [Prauserella sediminis]MCR3718670.1 transcriptional regulator, GntR family [Prauserella flava]MCR3733240.1 transcriptional regulator, GntR family [Prauserella salsuginis]
MDQDALEPRQRPYKRGDKVAQAVARSIMRKIRTEGLEPGAHLPSEAHMLKEYGIGRGSLREALRILEVNGLIWLKPGPGGGPIVSGAQPDHFGQMATLYLQAQGTTFRELIEARLAVEPLMARLAAQRQDPQHMDELRRVSGSLKVDDDAAYLEYTGDFHRLIAEMSGNGILSLLGQSLSDIFRDRVSGIVFPKSRRKEVSDAHVAIAKAIENGEPDAAHDLMYEHMAKYVNYVKRGHPTLINEVVDWR